MPADETFPYGRQLIDDDDIGAVVEVLRSDLLTGGPAIERFESGLCRATGAGYASVVNSGTSALHLAYVGVGVGDGQEVITTPMTFVATANAALFVRARPVFADCDPGTGLIDPCAIEAAITDRTSAIVAVDFAGHPADYAEINAIAQRHGVAVVADAAHSIGATYRGAPVGTLADATTFSFHPVKLVTTGEGGAVVTDDPEIDRTCRELRNHGIVRDVDLTRPADGPWSYEMTHLGFNYRMTDIQAALGASQLAKLRASISRRREIAERYDAAFADVEGFDTPVVSATAEPAWHLYVLRVREVSRRPAFFDELTVRGLRVQVHYLPVHLHPFYEELGYRSGSCPGAEDLYARCVSIPMYPALSDSDVDVVIDRVSAAARAVL